MNVSGGQFSRVFCAKLAWTETFLSKPSVFPKEIWYILLKRNKSQSQKSVSIRSFHRKGARGGEEKEKCRK